MYHVGKVIKVISPQDVNVKSSDDDTQALLEMWDENVVTFLVEPHIAKDIKDGDMVLVDYSHLSPTSPNAQIIIKILQGDTAKAVWDEYKKHYEKKKKTQAQLTGKMQQGPQDYFG